MILKRDSHGRHVCGYDLNLLRSCGSLSSTEDLVLLGELPFGVGKHVPPNKRERNQMGLDTG